MVHLRNQEPEAAFDCAHKLPSALPGEARPLDIPNQRLPQHFYDPQSGPADMESQRGEGPTRPVPSSRGVGSWLSVLAVVWAAVALVAAFLLPGQAGISGPQGLTGSIGPQGPAGSTGPGGLNCRGLDGNGVADVAIDGPHGD